MTMPNEHPAAERDLLEDSRMALHLASLGAVDLEKWARLKMPAVLDEVEAARARIVELEGELHATKDRNDELKQMVVRRDEAAQRPPLGYVVLRGDIDYDDIELVDQRVWPDLEIAGDASGRTGGTTYELREVRP